MTVTPKPTESVNVQKLPVRAVKLVVVDGPDKGRSATGDTVTVGTAEDNALVLTDTAVSGYHVELSCVADEIRAEDHGSTNGTWCGPVRLDKGVVPPGSTLKVGRTQLRVEDAGASTVDLHSETAFGGLRGKTSALRRVMATAAKVSRTDTPVLLVGESGTGKEVLARAIHDASLRAKGPFVTVDCGSLSPTLIANELFGHERGAFTGADAQHAGAFERARGGTLFLDELGELPTDVQPSLLGVLERQTFRRVGGKKDLETDVRIVAATNRDLRAEVNSGRFRLDLYFRVAVVRIAIPPLREHAEDVPLLAEHFIRELTGAQAGSAHIPAAMMKALMEHRWPGNVRELRNFVEATVALGEAPALDDLSAPGAGAMSALSADAFDAVLDQPYREARAALLNEFELRYLKRLLEQTGGNVTGAARKAQMDRSHMFELVRRHGLKRSDD